MKACSKCGVEKLPEMFSLDSRPLDGRRYSCKACDRDRHLKYRAENPDRDRYRDAERGREYSQQYRARHRAKDLVRHAKRRAEAKGLPFDLDQHIPALQKRLDRAVCEVTGIPLSLTGGRLFNSPSLDRKVPARGYVIRNTRVVCLAINCAMGDWGEKTLRAILQQWLSR